MNTISETIEAPLAKCAKSRAASPARPRFTSTTGSVVKMRFPASNSNAMPVNWATPSAVQRTNPTKSDVSVRGEHFPDKPGHLPVGR